MNNSMINYITAHALHVCTLGLVIAAAVYETSLVNAVLCETLAIFHMASAAYYKND